MSRLDATWELLMPDGRRLPESHTETCLGCAECEGAEVVRIEEQDECWQGHALGSQPNSCDRCRGEYQQ